MPSILHDFEVKTDPSAVYAAVSSPDGLDQWWTLRSSGEPRVGAEYELWFGPRADWRAKVTEAVPGKRFSLELTGADDDWVGTSVAFTLEPAAGGTMVRFSHSGWQDATEHFRISSFCWAMYLRVMRRFTESGEQVAYKDRIFA